jgi:hypothetical protein
MASYILNPTTAHIPCSRVLHVKCGMLPEDLVASADIGTDSDLSVWLAASPRLLAQRSKLTQRSDLIEDTASEGCTLYLLLVDYLLSDDVKAMREHRQRSKEDPHYPPFCQTQT